MKSQLLTQPILTVALGVYAAMTIHDMYVSGKPFDATLLLIAIGIVEPLCNKYLK